ncbi:hypothetical protein NXU86_21065 [Phocaeicola vulgatus]|nr:hypothetical protein [Phocaeicola vulgatus]
MAIKFEFYESPNTIGTRKKRYHARVVNWQRINTDYLAREIQYGSSLTVADIKATIISLSEKLAYYLKDGARVHIEGIGYFHISLTCPETRTPSSTRANKVKFKSVTFRADKYLEASVERRQDRAFEIQAALHAGNQREYRRSTDGILLDKQRADTPEV